MTEKKKRAPGGGRKPLPASLKRQVVTIRITPEQREHVQRSGGAKYIRELIEKDRITPP